MSLLEKEALLENVLSSVRDSGWDFKITHETHPFELTISKDTMVETIRVYIWNITHGGGAARAPDEYRIQITSVPRIDVTPPTKTLLLGWDERYRVFAGYNASRYTTFGASPSLQVKEGTLAKAAKEGTAIQTKELDAEGNITEVVVALKPEMLIPYIINLESYHRPSLTKQETSLLEKASIGEVKEQDLTILPEERRRAIREVNLVVRNTKFRKVVLFLYGYKCAICGLQLGIVEATHILPVEHGGTDEPTNGIALCPNHHKALDKGLMLVSSDYRIIINSKKLGELRSSGLSEGLEQLTEMQDHEIRLPQDVNFRPNPKYLKKRMRLEGFHLYS